MVTKSLKELPGSIRVGPHDIQLVLADNALNNTGDNHGMYTGGVLTISLSTEMANDRLVVEVLLHELTHALYHQYDLADQAAEETVVTATARGWTQVYRDNPWLLRWLTKWSK